MSSEANSTAMEPRTPIRNLENGLTPRRSGRKSIKPMVDYNDIILNKSVLRSHELEMNENQNKWSPAKVGRVSQKRSARKCRSVKKTKKVENSEETDCSDGNDDKEISDPKEGNINTTFDKVSDGKDDENKEISQLNEGNIEKILNSTFEMEEPLQNAELKENIVNRLEENVDEMKSNQKAQSQKAKLNQPIINLIKEGNDLGCTPILYEDNTGAEEETKEDENGKEIDLDCVPISNHLSFEKLEEEVFEEDPKQSDLQKSCVNTEKHNEKENLKLELDEPTVYERIEVISDDEMSLLILSDDEEEVDNDIKGGRKTFNDTFNTSDCIIISPSVDVPSKIPISEKTQMENLESSKARTNEVKKKVEVLKTNETSVKKTPVQVVPKITVTNDKNKTRNLLLTPRLDENRQNIATPKSAGKRQNNKPTSASKGQINVTPISSRKCPVVGTPASTSKITTKQSKGYRFPTPFKPKKDFRFGYQAKEDKENVDHRSDSSQVPSNITTLEPKDIVLRSIRKRSLSVTIDGDQRKRRAFNVTFHSPANQTASTADLDKLLALSAVKSNKNKTSQRERIPQRKRSLSLDENYLRNQPSKLPRPVLKSPKATAPVRKKVPNFAAIHQQQFQKMENIADYVVRKAERAQNLTNSALKTRNAAVAKSQRKLPLKPLNMDASNPVKKFEFAQNENSQPKVAYDEENEKVNEKLKKRTQRHIGMYKARTGASQSEKRTTAELIRGVRSNRRFELMMQHRNLHSNN